MKISLLRLGTLPLAVALGMGLAGCGGGSGPDNGSGGNPGPNVPLLGLTADGRTLLSFNANNPTATTSTAITGLAEAERLLALDFRVAPRSDNGNGQTGLYAVSNQNRLYTINTSTGAATALGDQFSFDNTSLTLTNPGFDFNPVPDRIRLVQGTFNGRLNPNTTTGNSAVDGVGQDTTGDDVGDGGEGSFTPDGTLRYAAGDRNQGDTPNVVAAAYTNNDLDTNTGTINYAIDAANNVLVTQGRPDPDGAEGPLTAASPNDGLLFSRPNNLGINVSGAQVGFEIANSNNSQGLLSVTSSGSSRLYTVNLDSGIATPIANGRTRTITGLTVANQ